MRKVSFIFSFALLLTACASSTATMTPTMNANWTAALSSQKMALRSCIIADKNIETIRYMDQQAKTITLVVQQKNGTALNCVVDSTSNKVITIEPSHLDVTQLRKFYPVGKKQPISCEKRENILDTEGRLMGIVCR